MTTLQVERTSTDQIKPSSPTPNHLKTYQFSFIDQFSPPVHMPLIFFYRKPQNTILLKTSLAETLVQFYPLAGRIEGNTSIDCNDEGVEYYEADVLASLVEVLENPEPEELLRLLPFAPVNDKSTVTGVQVNRFSCGGMALSVSISHKIGDAATAVAFINAWALKARSVSNIGNTPLARFDSASLFPQMDLNGIYNPQDRLCKEKTVTIRLIFHNEKIEQLRKQCDDRRQVNPPTRVEVVSAFILKQFIRVAKTKPMAPKTIIAAAQNVNLRAIKSSPIPQNSQGNLYWRICAHAPINATETKYPELVGMLRKGVESIDVSYLRKIQTGECLEKLKKDRILEAAVFCCFSSLTRFPLYEVNFGSGTPIWVSQTALPFINTVCMMSTRSGEGIEAWVHVLECDIAALKQDREFLSLVYQNVQAKL